MEILKQCFDIHSFAELNQIDFPLFINVLGFFLRKYNKKDVVYVDVGTNAGSFVKALQFYGIQDNIHCFEPHPILCEATKQAYPYVHINNFCLGNKNGTTEIYIPKWSVGLSSIIKRPVFSKLDQEIVIFPVKCETLDTYCEKNAISEIGFLKLDVEGAEKYILEGASSLLSSKKILCGLFETGDSLKDANTSEEEIIRLLEGYGYSIDKTMDKDNIFFFLP